jgi:ATP-dependent Clp protease protease subunit
MKKFIANPNVFAFAPVVRGNHSLSVVAKEDGETRIALIGGIGKIDDEDGITEKEVREAINSVPGGNKIELIVNSPGGSVKEGTGIHDAIYERRADIRVRITGYALSIASVFPLAAKRSLGGRGVVSAKGAIWMEHQASCIDRGNADEKRATAEMLEIHDESMATIYSRATGKSKEVHLARMKKTTWTKGADAVAVGLADESDDSPVTLQALSAKFLAKLENVPGEILAAAIPLNSAAPAKPAGNNQTQNTDNTMNKKVIVALLTSHGILNSTTAKAFTEADADADLEAGLNALAKKPGTDVQARLDAQDARMALAEKRRLTSDINKFVDAQKITKAEVAIFVEAALKDEAGTLAILEAKEPAQIGGQAAGTHVIQIMDGPTMSADGVQGSKVLPELGNIFANTKSIAAKSNDSLMQPLQAMARYEAMKAEFPKLLSAALRRDGGVQAGNTFSGTITTNFLILGVIVKLYNRFAPASIFTLDAEQDPYKPLAPGIRKFNTTTTDGTKVGKNVTNFQTLAGGTNGNPDSTISAITITPDQYTAAGFINNSQLNSGYRIADILESKLIDLADAITQVFTAPITVANFTTNAPVISAPAAFGFSDLATLQGVLKKTAMKNLLLDGEYIARIANVPGFFQTAGTVGGPASAWKAYGWDNVALNTEWTGAGANVRGFGCGKNAIGIISGLPLNPPEGIPGNIVQTGVAQLPDVQKAIATYTWFDAAARSLFFSFDMIAGATLIDETQGVLVKSA